MLELKNITYSVDGGIDIIKDLSLSIDDGKFVVITGPNGGGKSTLAKIIAGIVTPTQGQIIMDGADITNMSITDRARNGISFAFQQPVRFKGFTVRDLISLAAGYELTNPDACKCLSEVGLCGRDYVDREVNGSLSGGELKRIEIAMIMMRKSRLSIFDEPEAGIDLWSFKNLIDVFEKLHNETKGSIMIISHQERILNIADEIIVVADGQISSKGARDMILPGLLSNTTPACGYFKGGVC